MDSSWMNFLNHRLPVLEWDCPSNLGFDHDTDSLYSQIQIHAPTIIAGAGLTVILIQTLTAAPKSNKPSKNQTSDKATVEKTKTLNRQPPRPTLKLIQAPPSSKDVDRKTSPSSKPGKLDLPPFAPPFLFQVMSLLLAGSFMLDSVVVIIESIACQVASESLFFYLSACFSVFTIIFASLALNLKKAPTIAMLTVWITALILEIAMCYLSPPSLFNNYINLGSPIYGNSPIVTVLNLWNFIRWAAQAIKLSTLFLMVLTYVLCLSDAGNRTVCVTLNSLYLGTLLEIPLVEKVDPHEKEKGQEANRAESYDIDELRDHQQPTRTGTMAAVDAVQAYQQVVNATFSHPNPSSGKTGDVEVDKIGGGEGGVPQEEHITPPLVPAQKPKRKNQTDSWERPKKGKSRSWREYVAGYQTYSKHLWPKPTYLRYSIIACVIICLLERVINPLSSYSFKKIIRTLEETQAAGSMAFIPVRLIVIYSSLKLVQGSKGWLQHGRSLMWSPIQQYTYKELSTDVFKHVHSLPYAFHIQAKATELLSAINKGGSVTTFLENVSFSVIPAVIDILITITYFVSQFGPKYARIIVIMSCLYIYVTMSLAQWRTSARRELADSDRKLDAVKLDSLFAYKTVQYFNTQDDEVLKLTTALTRYQRCQWNAHLAQIIMEAAQSLIFICGLLVVCLAGTADIAQGRLRTSDLATLIDYMVQVRGPLNVFSDFYRMVQNAMINAERMTELFKLESRIPDNKGAIEMKECMGDVEIKDVTFTFPGSSEPALSHLNLKFEPGTFTALVGASGGGKSTIFDLLYRFFDADEGSILMDGVESADIISKSFKEFMAIVPQRITLAHDTIMNNVRYVRPQATDEEVKEACKEACIHEDIEARYDKYDTMIGSGGASLSGGQIQRLGLARAILRKPKIILLDEPTSALDAITEELVRGKIESLCKDKKCTVIMIAHRLFTTTNTDKIYVLDKGTVIEEGSYTQLMANKDAFFRLWNEQKKGKRRQKAKKDLHKPRDYSSRRRHSTSELQEHSLIQWEELFSRRSRLNPDATESVYEEGERDGGVESDIEDRADTPGRQASSIGSVGVEGDPILSEPEGPASASTSADECSKQT